MKRNKNFVDNKNVLYLVAIPIGNLKEMTPRALEVFNMVDIIASEDTRNTASLLSKFNIKKELFSLREHNEVTASLHLVDLIKQGKKVAYVSDAGYPCISDPGKILVQKAKEADIPVSTISGSCAFINALVASFIPSDRFYFYGFLSPKESQAKKELEDLKSFQNTIIFYEAPHRILKTLKVMYEVFKNRKITLARELTKLNEEYIEGTLEELVSLDESTLIGEMVIIVEGNQSKEDISDEDILKQYDLYIENNVKSKDAIKLVAEQLKIKKNYVYDLVIEHRK